jgi:hypothetical protein
MAKVLINGTELDLPDAAAAAYTAQTEKLLKLEADAKATAEALGAAKAQADAKAKAEEDARRKAEQDVHIKKGEYDKALELERNQTKAVAERFRDSELKAMIATHPGIRDDIRDTIVADAVELLRGRAQFDFNTGKILINGDDGKPTADAKAFVTSWLSGRPAWLKPNGAAGSGADQSRLGSGSPTGLKRGTMSPEDKGDYILKHGKDAYFALPA